jgi:MFS family permease
MFSPQVKTGAFVLEGLNSFATALYFNFLFFVMRDEFGFTNLGNLTLCAVNGLCYALAAWFGGKFAQRHGYLFALKLGFGTMGLALGLGVFAGSVAAHYAVMMVWTLGMCLTWPSLEAVVSEHERPGRLQRLIGIYNVTWAAGSGAAYFLGGALLETLGRPGIFLVPAALHAIQVGLVFWLERVNRHWSGPDPDLESAAGDSHPCPQDQTRSPVSRKTCLRMAWVANPFAYIAINAILPVVPGIAEKLDLSDTQAGIFCSVWFFARAAAFVGLWLWTGWHYRFRWLIGAAVGMVASFAVILFGTNLWLLVAAQVVFGSAVALIYYSSLFYSMDVGDTKGEHGGFHEAAIGIGICAGPAVGAGSLYFLPQFPNTNAWAVTALLVAGCGWLLALRYARKSRGPG